MKIGLSVTVLSIATTAIVVGELSASVARPSYLEADVTLVPKLIFSSAERPLVLPQTNLPSETVSVGDGDAGGFAAQLTKALDVLKEEPDDVALPADADPVFDTDKVLTDSVTAVESRVFVFTDFIDTVPADDDVDPDPVTIAETDAKDIIVGELADNDDVTMSEASAKEATKPGLTATVTMSEGIDDFDIGLNPSDTATASEAIDDFDVDKVLADSVSVTEAIANNFTQISTDSVNAVQSNVKTFTSNVDFDLSDADVDPDPVTASDAIDDFDVTKGLTDTTTAAESDAKEVTLADIADNDTASVTESDAKDFTHGGFSDSLTAVEGIKNNPELAKTEAVTASESNTFDVRPALSDSFTPSDAVDDFDIQLAKSDTVNVSDVNVKNFTENVDFDRSDADADADPVTVTETLGFDATHPLSDSFTPSDATPVFTFTNVYTDAATATESISTLLTLGESEYVYPDFVSVSDGERRFVEEFYSYNISGTDYYVPFTGVIGMAETVNTVMLANDRVTAPDASSAGLAVNFLYTDVDEDDRALGGYYFNQTPLNPGNSTVGQRVIL